MRKPKKKRLNRKLKSVIQFEVRGVDPDGHDAVSRGYVWNVGSKQAGRLIILTTRNPTGPMNAETEFVLDQLRNTK